MTEFDPSIYIGHEQHLGSMEVGMKKARFIDLGPIADVIEDKFEDEPRMVGNPVWTGAISPRTRMTNNLELASTIETALANLDEFYVPVSNKARTRCIDGRLLEGFELGREHAERDLGPQVPGGTPSVALVNRIVDGGEVEAGLSFEDDIEEILTLFKNNGIIFGGHVDDHDHEENTGCGAIDKIPEILKKISQFEAQPEIRGLVRMMLGHRFDADIYNMNVGRMVALQGAKSRYFLRDPESGNYSYRKKVIEALQSNATDHNPVARLTGAHNEVGLVINTVPNTTFDRDYFSYSHDNEVQLFNYDIWDSKRMAGILYPIEDDAQPQQRRAMLQKQDEFLTCRAMFAVATAMVLTDGSVRLIVRDQP